MISALILFLPLFLLGLFLFLKRHPEVEPTKQGAVARFDRAVFLAVLLVSAGAAAYFRLTTGRSVDRPWWPVLAVLSALALSSVVFLIGFVVRNLTFKPRRRNE